MSTRKRILLATLMLACSAASVLAADTDRSFVRISPEQVPFRHTAGVEQVILYGDPSKAGIYVIRVRFPPGMHSTPHYHSQDRHVTVLQGTWMMGAGDKDDASLAVPMKAGSYALHPARAIHWDGAGDEETIVQIIGMGPVETVQIDSKRAAMSQWPLPIGR